jgi:hypothetical protein
MNGFRKSCFLSLLLSFPLLMNAQFNYKKGSIITQKNDTIAGYISDGGGIRNTKFCLFKETRQSPRIKYHPADINAYWFDADKKYKTNEVFKDDETTKVFTEVLLEGNVSLFHYWKNKEQAFYIQKKGDNLIGLLNKKVVLPISSEGLYGLENNISRIPVVSESSYNKFNSSVYSEIYKDTLYSFFKDSKDLQNQTENVEYSAKSLINFTSEYINTTCSGANCIIYKKDLKKGSPSFGVYSGIQVSQFVYWKSQRKYYSSEGAARSGISASIPIGLFYNIPLNLLSDRLSIQMELLVHHVNYKLQSVQLPDSASPTNLKINSRLIGIPLLIKYRIERNKLAPTFAIGKEMGIVSPSDVSIYDQYLAPYDLKLMVYRRVIGGWFCDLGMEYKLGMNHFLFSNLRIQSFENIIVESDGPVNRSSIGSVLKFKSYDMYRNYLASVYIGIRF